MSEKLTAIEKLAMVCQYGRADNEKWWRGIKSGTRYCYLLNAKKVLAFLGFPEGCEPEEGCVRKAVEALSDDCAAVCHIVPKQCATTCGIGLALRALKGGGDE